MKEGEVVCRKCKGKGFGPANKNNQTFTCGNCKGTGVTDWVSNLIPKTFYYVKPGVYVGEVDLSYRFDYPCDRGKKS